MGGVLNIFMNNLYNVLKKNDEEVTIELSNEKHPIFMAHFPQYPVLPGFTLIDILAKVLSDKVEHIKYAKFIAHILPNDILECKIKTNNKKRMIKVFKNNKKVSEISYESK